MGWGLKNIFKPIQQFFTGGSRDKNRGGGGNSSATSNAADEQQKAAAAKAAADAENARKAAEAARIKAELTARKGRNEAEVSSRNRMQMEEAAKQTQETVVNNEEQREREKMARTFQSRKRGRASLRINLGSNSGSSYEGSSGISISI